VSVYETEVIPRTPPRTPQPSPQETPLPPPARFPVSRLLVVVLTNSGQIWIAEIKSRFVDPSFNTFVERLKGMGLKLVEMDQENKMFVIMRFEKIAQKGGEKDVAGQKEEGELLKACLYKKR